ncbi:ATP-binding protein [Parendozoicomonas sp. Alg238-R29]|uniref:ATP-binding protein n=1 Tax=Parendozoicomonas sp. Alg238-R29 TaxID=2993446 RepID=UPI00248EDA1F|nr:ATP-binding protein [Parendozoicomonas sp. Alg238-R29]
MRLSRQLLLVGLLVLLLPVAGVRWVQEMELTFREQQAHVLSASLRAATASLSQRQLLPQPVEAKGAVYVQPVGVDLVMDGYFEDWQAQNLTSRIYIEDGSEAGNMNPAVQFSAATDSANLYLAFKVTEDKTVHYNPVGVPLKNGDRVQLFVREDNRMERYTIVTEAPGQVVARTVRPWNSINRIVRENRIRGVWRDIHGGYQLELVMPLAMAGEQLGFTVISGATEYWAGSVGPGEEPGALILPDRHLSRTLEVFLEDDMRLGILDSAGWQIASTNSSGFTHSAKQEEPFWLISWFYRAILSWNQLPDYQNFWRSGGWQSSPLSSALDGQPVTLWQRKNDRYRLLASWPLVKDGNVVGALIAEQGSQAVMSLASRSFNRLFSLSFLAIILVSAGLLGYASWLSFRIRKLHRATEQCIGRDGRLRTSFPASKSSDELGELSRSIAAMVTRQENHTEYLRSLGSKLSHELRTPLAVVRSSLDNLAHEQVGEQGRVYVSRALAGADRLGGLLNSISEATRLENIIADSAMSSEWERIDLRLMLEDLFQAYSGVYPKTHFNLVNSSEACETSIQPELVVQAMDKLVSNAVDFCPVDGSVTLHLAKSDHHIVVSVENDGPLLPGTMEGRLFDSMVSVRTTRGEKPHLGLGLYIVRLVMDAHSGTVKAENRRDGKGVIFSMIFEGE